MARHTTFRFCLNPTAEQRVALARHSGAARFAYNECLRMVKTALTARRADPTVEVPWTGFDLINAFNAWKKTEAAGRIWAVGRDGVIELAATGLAWRGEVCQQVFEEAAVDCGHALTAWADSRSGRRNGRRVGFPRFNLHQVSNALVKTHEQLVLEDLNVTGMLANHRLAQAIADAGWADFARMLRYKQAWRGGQFELADRYFPSTKTCAACDSISTHMALGDRRFICECGYSADRDHNAAVNLARWAQARYDVDRSPDPQAGGRATNARRRAGAIEHARRAGDASPKEAGTKVHTTRV